ncbi:hypothetical protein ABZP36_030789 [Zizania latifolia]
MGAIRVACSGGCSGKVWIFFVFYAVLDGFWGVLWIGGELGRTWSMFGDGKRVQPSEMGVLNFLCALFLDLRAVLGDLRETLSVTIGGLDCCKWNCLVAHVCVVELVKFWSGKRGHKPFYLSWLTV